MIVSSMRVATFSVVRGLRGWGRPLWGARGVGSGAPTATTSTETDERTDSAHDEVSAGEQSHLCFAASWPVTVEPGLRARMAWELRVLPSFVTEPEEQRLMEELEPALRRMRYEYDHWDDAIHGYKETERGEWRPENEAVMARVRAAAFPTAPGALSLPPGATVPPAQPPGATVPPAQPPGAAEPPQSRCHVLDLAPGGHIKPHIDAVRYCGSVIAGLCLLSDAVMRLRHETRPELQVDALLPRRGLYIMTGVARYSFTHAVLGNEESSWRGQRVVKRRRVAVITRSEPRPADHQGETLFYTESGT